MKLIRVVAVAVFVAAFGSVATAQISRNVDLSGTVKTSHLWRGMEVSNSLTGVGTIDLMTNDGSLKGGIWGGYSVNGRYKEFDYYLQYSKSGFTVALWDIYNFSPGNQYDAFDNPTGYNTRKAFEYAADKTGHFIDLSVAYRFQGNFPLQISWATVIFGRDRALNKDGEMKNQYSNYVALDYSIGTFKGVKVDVGIAGAFAFRKAYQRGGYNISTGSFEYVKTDANFYGNTNGIVNINATASKDITIGGFTFPVSVTGMWNPMSEDVFMCVAIGLF